MQHRRGRDDSTQQFPGRGHVIGADPWDGRHASSVASRRRGFIARGPAINQSPAQYLSDAKISAAAPISPALWPSVAATTGTSLA